MTNPKNNNWWENRIREIVHDWYDNKFNEEIFITNLLSVIHSQSQKRIDKWKKLIKKETGFNMDIGWNDALNTIIESEKNEK